MTGPLHGIRVIVVDDDRLARTILHGTLEAAGAEVIACGDGEAALAAVEADAGPATVLISDLNMPHMSGVELIRRVRALPKERGGRMPAAAISGDLSVEVRTNALQSGFQGVIGKRMEKDHLVKVVLQLRSLGGPVGE